MIKIITTEQAKALDEYTIREEPIPEVELVERAAKAFAEEFMRRFGKENRVVVFAGQGNNGADALAIARILQNKAYKKVETFLLNPPTGRQCSETCKEHQQRLLRSYPEGFREVTRQFNPPPLHPGDVVIDGLFGSGLNRPLAGGFAALVDYINRSAATVVAVDLPSGLFDRDNRENPAEGILRAKVTLTFAFPKLSFFLPENEAFVGEWQVIDIGLHPKAVAQTPTSFYQITPEDLAGAFPPRRKFAHKGLYGHALLLAGSRGKMGAALLAAKACLRSGAGRLTAHIPHGGDTALQTAIPEAMLSLDAHPNCVSQQPPTTPYTAIALGPGLGSDPATGAVLEAILRHESRPLILDADALNLIARNPEWLALIPPQSILTPHPQEFDRRGGASASGDERRMEAR
ncbi:MAG: NAD(P)H-hydrate epimerase, partial [Tannerellaceae bacterium]|nr:NAD(P)H-hydrate epimerase [Tannerellaceae bacterium]